MSALCPMLSQDTGAGATASPAAAPPPVEFRYTQTEGFVALLHQLGASLLVSTYQANKLLVVRAAGDGLSTLVRTFERPMGLAADAGRLALGTRDQVWTLRNAPHIARHRRHCHPRDGLGRRRIVDRQHALLMSVHLARRLQLRAALAAAVY